MSEALPHTAARREGGPTGDESSTLTGTITEDTSPAPSGRVLIAATKSGSGKTTTTVALIAALRARGLPVTAFKCGPDYIDPTFHRAALGVPSHNLDPFFCAPDELSARVGSHGQGRISVIEGVMGLYDGIGATTRASTYDVARATSSPIALVVDARGMAASLGALLAGFTGYDADSLIRGVIVNNVSDAMRPMYEEIIRRAGLAPLGFLPKSLDLTIPDRRLGLVTAGEVEGIDETIAAWGEIAEEHLDLAAILRVATTPPSAPTPSRSIPDTSPACSGSSDSRSSSRIHVSVPPLIAVARDEAFCFMYAETLESWEEVGGEIAFFSPLADSRLPEGASALYLPGGYPENHAAALSSNSTLRGEIRARINAGLPTIAECGGFMYLHGDIDGHPMCAVIGGSARTASSLQRFGYATMTATQDNLLCDKGGSLPVHEFHYCESTAPGSDFTLTKASTGSMYREGHASPTMYAGFPHVWMTAQTAQRFVRQAGDFAARAQRLGRRSPS